LVKAAKIAELSPVPEAAIAELSVADHLVGRHGAIKPSAPDARRISAHPTVLAFALGLRR
jgi:hypothetical protein